MLVRASLIVAEFLPCGPAPVQFKFKKNKLCTNVFQFCLPPEILKQSEEKKGTGSCEKWSENNKVKSCTRGRDSEKTLIEASSSLSPTITRRIHMT